jgi:hypothetical protein
MRNQIITRAANACSRSEVAHVVLSAVVETHAEPGDVQLEDVKSLLVDAVRAWRARNGVREVATAVGDFVGASPQAVHA